MDTQTAQIVKWMEENISAQMNVHWLLDNLVSHYSNQNPLDNEVIREKASAIELILRALSQKRERKLLRTMRELCREYRETAFCDGVCLGIRLMVELLIR